MAATEMLRIATPWGNEALSLADGKIHECTASIRDGNAHHVRGTWGESLFPLTSGWDSQNGANKAHIGHNH